jgi:hypothetical protein
MKTCIYIILLFSCVPSPDGRGWNLVPLSKKIDHFIWIPTMIYIDSMYQYEFYKLTYNVILKKITYTIACTQNEKLIKQYNIICVKISLLWDFK